MDAPLKVAHLCAGNLYGGVETFLETFARREATVGMESHFLVGWEGRHADGLRAAGARVEIVGGARLSRPWQILKVRRRIRECLQQIQPDLVLVHSGWTQWVMGPAAVKLGIPMVLWLHNDLPHHSALHLVARRVRPAGLIANSRFTAASALAWYALEPRVIYLPVPAPHSSLPPNSRSQLRATLGAGEGTVVLLQASRLQAWKGHRQVLAALGPLRQRTDWVWWIAGGAQRPEEEAYRQSLMRQATELGLSGNIRWLGHRDDMPAVLAAADIYCQVNETPEPFGLVFLEALHTGLPVVTGDAGGISEVVDDTCGRTVTSGDTLRLTAVLSELMDQPDLRKSLGSHGPARASLVCDPDHQMTVIASCLREIAGVHRLESTP